MTRTEREQLLDQAIDAVREDLPSRVATEEASQRAWGALDDARKREAVPPAAQGAPLDSIESYVDLIPDYLARRLAPGTLLLFKEELKRSVALRRALDDARAGAAEKPSDHGSSDVIRAGATWPRWLAAAAAVAIVALTMTLLLPQLPALDQSRLVQIESVDGALYQISQGGMIPLEPGIWVDGERDLRTAKESKAVLLLDDGSRIEVDERSQLRFLRRQLGNLINVKRGQIIVSASPQGAGTLDVMTAEFLVSVTGTIFEVGHGAKGSRVSVIEGEVEVNHLGLITSLFSGEQLGTRETLESLTIEAEIAWSSDADRYMDMLQEVSALQQEIAGLMTTEPRYSTRLLDLAPADTVVYIAVPNATAKVVQAYELLRMRMFESELLQQTWTEFEQSGSDGHLEDLMAWLGEVGYHLGDETVMTLSLYSDDQQTDVTGEVVLEVVPMVFSEVDAEGFRETFEVHLAQLRESWAAAGVDHDLEFSIIDDPSEAQDGVLSIWLYDDLLIATTDAVALVGFSEQLLAQASGFVGSDFHTELLDVYDLGAEFLAAVDLAEMFSHVSEPDSKAMEIVGLDNARYLIVERRQEGDRTTAVADLRFDGERRGMASWLARPAPMGALEFFSVDTMLATAFVIKDPVDLLSELVDTVLDEREALTDVEALDRLSDVAAALGGEFAIGLDGPALPEPSWKVVIEVYDESRLQQNIELLVDRINEDEANRDAGFQLELSQIDLDHLSRYRIEAVAEPDSQAEQIARFVSLHYAYVDGYLIAAPSNALIDRAIGHYQSGATLLTSDTLWELLPQDGYLGFSGIAYSRMGELTSEFAAYLPGDLTPEQQQAFDEISANALPTISCVYGEVDSIRFVMKGGTDLFGFSDMLGLHSIMAAVSGQSQIGELIRETIEAEVGDSPWQ
jgi:hypothetical protein|tara:strand:- start:6503 stop:9226 length:2724 start_codon:yes stop_codon:yes gene_type:complete